MAVVNGGARAGSRAKGLPQQHLRRVPAVHTPAPVRTPAPAAAASVSMVGVILAERMAEVAPRYQGRLRAMNVRLGDRVREGQVLGALDVTVTRFDVPKARAALRAIRVEEQRAVLDAAAKLTRRERTQRLLSSSLISEEEAEAAQHQERAARLHIAGIRAERGARIAELERLQQVHAEAEVRAPFAGVIARRYADPGASVDMQTPLVSIVGDGGRFVRFAAPEEVASQLQPGAEVAVQTPSVALRATIVRIAPEVDAASRTIAIEATLAAQSVDPLVGEMVRVTLRKVGP